MGWKSIHIKVETDKLLTKAKCTFIKHHPDWRDKHITYDHIISWVARYYDEH